jgi:hypothetical protein
MSFMRHNRKPQCANCGCTIEGYVWKDSGYTFCHPTCEGHGKQYDVCEVELYVFAGIVMETAPWVHVGTSQMLVTLNLN